MLNIKKLIVLNFTFLILIAGIFGCDKTDKKSDVESAGLSIQNIVKLKIGIMSDVGAVPFLMAQELGLYQKHGLEVDLQVFKSAMDRDTMLQTGNLDGAMADMLSVIFFNEAGINIKMTSDTFGNYQLVSSPALDTDSFLKLPKKPIGVSSNTVIEFATQKIAIAKNFETTLELVAIPQMPVRLEILTANKLSGATLPEPLASAALSSGGELIGSTRDLELYPAVFIMTQLSIDKNLTGIKLFYDAYNETIINLNEKNCTEYFDILVEKLAFPASLKGKFDMPKFEKIGSPDKKTFDEISAWMLSKGLIKSQYSFGSLYESSWQQ